jgi:hypothetical protein
MRRLTSSSSSSSRLAVIAGGLLAAALAPATARGAQQLTQFYSFDPGFAINATSTQIQYMIDVDPQYAQFNPDNGAVLSAFVNYSVWGLNTLQAQAVAPQPFDQGSQFIDYGIKALGNTPFDLENGNAVNYNWASQASPITGSITIDPAAASGTGAFSAGHLTSGVQISTGLYPMYAASTLHLRATVVINYDTNPAVVSVPDEVKFGNVLVGQSSTKTLSVSNTGGLPTIVTQTGNAFGYSPDFTPTTGSNQMKVYGHSSAGRDYTFAPSARGDELGLNVTRDPANNSYGTYLSGTGVAPVAQLASSDISAGNVRVGTTGTASLVVRNVGDGSLAGSSNATKLSAHAPAGLGAFSLTGSAAALVDDPGPAGTTPNSKTFAYTFAPTSRGPASAALTAHFDNGNPNGTNVSADLAFNASGTGVGPVFDTVRRPIDDTLDFGPPRLVPIPLTLFVDNASTDGDLGDLTLLDFTASLTDDAAGAFSIITAPDDSALAPGAGTQLTVQFDPSGLPAGQQFTANLVFHTDQNAATGDLTDGQAFIYTLTATAPEPATLATLGLGLLALTTRRRRV